MHGRPGDPNGDPDDIPRVSVIIHLFLFLIAVVIGFIVVLIV